MTPVESRKEWTQRRLIERVTGLPVPSAKQQAQWAQQERDAQARYRQQQAAAREYRKAHPNNPVTAILWLIASWLILGGIVWGIWALVHH
jgi:hypothetical protein